MHKASAVALLLAAAVSPSAALVKFPIVRRNDLPVNHLSPRHLERRGTITETLLNNHTGSSLYMATVSVGTPPQTIALDIDTGSSDVYVIATGADECTSSTVQAQYGGCFGGTFDYTKSSTFKDIKGGFEVAYGDKTGATGEFVSDAFAIGGATIKDLIMGLVNQTTTGSGLMGIGYDVNEHIITSGVSATPYKSIMDTMLDQGLINTKSYSLYLDDQTATSGTVIFGGVDTGKFIGPMKVLSIVPENGVYQEMLIPLTGITITNQTGVNTALTSSSFSIPILLDSGSSLTYLPTAIFQEFATAFNAVNNQGSLIIDCAYKTTQSRGYVSFTFSDSTTSSGSSITINVPIDELIQPLGADTKNCLLGVLEGSAHGTYILGDVFLRSAYVVYDLSHNQIGLAQANYESSVSALVEFTAADNGIPSLTGQATGATLEPGSKSGAAQGLGKGQGRGGEVLVVGMVTALFGVLGGAWFLG